MEEELASGAAPRTSKLYTTSAGSSSPNDSAYLILADSHHRTKLTLLACLRAGRGVSASSVV